MGLNVYFCDVCGVRVTDVDLRSGHGMLRGQDVICATCLEMGHGKEWLAARGGEVALAGAVSAPQSASQPRGAQAANDHSRDNASYKKLVDHARDRAVTVPDEDGDTGTAHLHEPHDAAHVRQLDHEDTGLVDSIPAEFSGAAVSFAALTQSPTHARPSESTGDVAEDIAEEIDPLLLVPASPVTLRASDEHLASPYVEKPPEDDDSSALINVTKNPPSARSKTSSSDAKGRDSARKSGASSSRVGKPSSVSAVAKKTPSSANIAPAKSNSSSKVGKPKTGRSGKRSVVGSMSMPLKLALITVPLILLIALVVIVSRGSGSAKLGDVKDLKAQQSQISRNFAEAQRLVNDAWVSKDVQQMKAADARWKQFMLEWDQFSGDVKKYSHWTEENCSDYWEGLHAPDVYNRTRLLRDEISKQTPH